MTEPFEVDDRHDRRLALGATGLLRDFNQAGVLDAADVHVADAARRRWPARPTSRSRWRWRSPCGRCAAGRSASTSPTGRDRSATEVAALAGARRPGATAVAASPLAARRRCCAVDGATALPRPLLARGGPGLRRPARPADQRRAGRRRGRARGGLDRVFPLQGYDEQRDAAARPPAQWTTVLTGGPGTGKTTTVAGLLALLAEQAEQRGEPPLRIALAAPTGKAAARLQQAVARRSAEPPRTRPTAPGWPGSGADPAPAARLAARQPRPGSGTTATTGCRTTWSWSTRPRWCR